MDFEANSTQDANIYGTNNCIINCDSGSSSGGAFTINSPSNFCEINGGFHRNVANGGNLTRLMNFVFNKISDGSTLNDVGTNTIRSNITNGVTPSGKALDAFVGWTAWTPHAFPSSGTGFTYTSAGRYLKVGKTVFFSLTINISANGTGAGAVNVDNLPIQTTSATDQVAVGRNNDGPGLVVPIGASSTNLGIIKYDGSYPMISAASILTVSGCYECI
jgi:hypothetical protein